MDDYLALAIIDQNDGKVICMTESQLRDFAKRVIQEYEASGISAKPRFIFNNKTLQEYLGVNHRLLAKYRNDGYLGYTQIGEKFFYTQQDVDRLLRSNYYEAFRCKD